MYFYHLKRNANVVFLIFFKTFILSGRDFAGCKRVYTGVLRIMRFSVGAAAPNVLAAVVAAALAAAAVLVAAADHRRAETTATPNKPGGKPFSVWFRAEPDLPRKRDMKAKKLNRLIGSDYDEMWMSKTPMLTAVSGHIIIISRSVSRVIYYSSLTDDFFFGLFTTISFSFLLAITFSSRKTPLRF